MAIGNHVSIEGFVRTRPHFFEGKSPVTKMRIASVTRYFDKKSGERQKRTDWFPIVAFGKKAHLIAENVRKGDKVEIEGQLRQGYRHVKRDDDDEDPIKVDEIFVRVDNIRWTEMDDYYDDVDDDLNDEDDEEDLDDTEEESDDDSD